MCPRWRRSAELSSRGTSPIAALTWPADEKRATSSTNARNVSATTGPTPGTRLQPLHDRIGVGLRLQPGIQRGDLGRQRRDRPAERGDRRRQHRPAGPAAPAGAARARCCPRPADSPIAGVTTGSAQSSRSASAPAAGDSAAPAAAPAARADTRCVARYQPRRFASASAATSRRSVLTLRRISPYIGA